MFGVASTRRVVALLVATLVPLGLAGPALAAKPVRGSVTIAAPSDGSAGSGINLVVAGAAKNATSVAVTIPGDVNTYDAAVVRGSWQTTVNPLPAGTTQICAEAYDAGRSVARACISYTVEVDGQYLSLFPEDGARVQSTFSAVGGCHDGSTVRLTLDGSSVLVPCVQYSFEHRYTEVPEGEHVLTAEQLAVDGSTVVASVTRTFTSAPIPVATVDITSPEDGSSADSTTVVVSGTETSNVDALVRVYLDGVFTDATTATDGQWSSTIPVDWGTHEICAEKSDELGSPIARDCVTHTVTLLDTSLTITSPREGSAQQTFATAEGACVGDLVVDLTVDGDLVDRLQCSQGRWVTNLFLGDGPHTLSASMSAGGTTVTSSVSFTVDSTPPSSPVVLSPSPGSTLTSVPVTLTGTADPGSTVTAYDTNADPYRAVVADAGGSWTITLERDFFETAGVLTGRPGSLTFSVIAADDAGNQADSTTVTFRTRLR
ncbi:hypothetical protein EKO23_23580 [Nocardioides guangzhouensis]|uniref:Uncharacterized protein n=1 Tax=Nocardioides guangzhouensis TaxID=2497878 RepID=A0A4Q4Z1H0_9ACTN|nr:Ig-like domain-containing protein [Nocardioides guangzhouensis]RYP81447.1 hypothetical protein EKO23_23580 [Nocardioides guangzhouensis]